MDLQAAREEVIGCFRPLDPAEVVLGQYDGYRDVPGVDPHSNQNTFVAARLWVDNDRWRGVPFYLRTGKELAASAQRVSLILRDPPGPLARPAAGRLQRALLLARGRRRDRPVAGDQAAGPGVDLDVAHASIPLASLKDADPLPAYVRLIHDVLLGDRSLFTRPDGLASVWKVAQPLLDNPPEVKPYARGSWGPAEAASSSPPGTGSSASKPSRLLAPFGADGGVCDSSVKRTFASGLPSTHWSRTATPHGLSGPWRWLNSSTKSASTRRVGRIGDHLGLRRQVGDHAVLQMEGEARVGRQVGQPVPGTRGRDPAQVDRILEPVEDDLDPPRLTRAPARGGDVDRPVRHRRGAA